MFVSFLFIILMTIFFSPQNTLKKMKRRIIYHAGPTNSGKTHTALEQLSNSESGVYCGPLRLLAQEIYERLNDEGVACWLRTGQQFLNEVSLPFFSFLFHFL